MTKKQRKKKKQLQMKNKRLIRKYYWLAPRNVWTNKIPKDYDYTYIEWGWSDGWDKAFGWLYLKELGEAIKESELKDFRILQQKEKYGQCRNYTSGASQKVFDIIDKYEHISEHVCYYCGKEAPMTDVGFVLPQCFKCFCRIYRRREEWCLKNHPEMSPKTDEELREMYEKSICDEPDENGEYHIPETYTIRRYSNGITEDITYDISDTVRKIRKRIDKYI